MKRNEKPDPFKVNYRLIGAIVLCLFFLAISIFAIRYPLTYWFPCKPEIEAFRSVTYLDKRIAETDTILLNEYTFDNDTCFSIGNYKYLKYKIEASKPSGKMKIYFGKPDKLQRIRDNEIITREHINQIIDEINKLK